MKKILLSCACCLLAVGLLAGCNNEEEEDTPNAPDTTVPSTGGDDGGSGSENEPIVLPDPAKWEVDGTYLLGFPDSVSDATELLYIDGATVAGYSYEGSLTSSVVTAVQVTVGAVEVEDPEAVAIDDLEGGDDGNDDGENDDEDEEEDEDEEPAPTPYTLSFEFRGSTYYITIVTSGDYTNLSYSTSEAYIYWNEEYECWGNEDGSYFLCNNARYGCLYASKVEDYIASSPIAALYDIPEGTVHEDKPLTAPIPGAYSGGEGTYWLGITMSEVNYYFTGEVYSSNYGKVAEAYQAVEVTLAAVVGETGGYTLSFTDPADSSSTVYLNMTESGTYHNVKWTTDSFTWTWDTRCEAFVATDTSGVVYYLGTRGTYTEIDLRPYEDLSGDSGTSTAQYPAKLFEIQALVAPSSITVSASSSEVYTNGRVNLEVEVTTDSEYADPTVEWVITPDSSSNEATGTIEDNVFTAGSTAGTVTISAKSTLDDTVTATGISITITAAPDGLLAVYDFSLTSHNETTSQSADVIKEVFDESYAGGSSTTSLVTAVTTADKVIPAAGGSNGLGTSTDCLKLGTGSAAGTLSLTSTESVSKIVLKATGWSSSQSGVLAINNVSQTISINPQNLTDVSSVSDTTYEITGGATELNFVTSGSGSSGSNATYRVLIFTIEFYSDTSAGQPS